MSENARIQLNKLYEFSVEQLRNRPAIFAHTPALIENPGFFSMKKFQDFINNPLLTPEWIHIQFNNQPVPLDRATLSRVAQQNDLRFMDKQLIEDYIGKGAAIVLEGIDIMDPDINDYIRRVDESLPCPATSDCAAFFSQRGQDAYGGHRDSDDVVIIQIAGEKNWKIFEPQQRRYLGNTSLNAEQMGPIHTELTTRPGDAMYIRAGVPHMVQTTAAFSLHLSFDITDRTTNIDQITQEANMRFNHGCEDSFAPASRVMESYINLLSSEQFQADVAVANKAMKREANLFRERIGKTSMIQALSRFS